MLGPISYQPWPKTFYLAVSAAGVFLNIVGLDKGFIYQTCKNSQQFFTVAFFGFRENRENRIIDGISVKQLHRPSAESRSCRVSNSSAAWPLPSIQRSKRRASSRSHSGSFWVDWWRKYSAKSRRSSNESVSTARFISATLTLVVTLIPGCISRRLFDNEAVRPDGRFFLKNSTPSFPNHLSRVRLEYGL